MLLVRKRFEKLAVLQDCIAPVCVLCVYLNMCTCRALNLQGVGMDKIMGTPDKVMKSRRTSCNKSYLCEGYSVLSLWGRSVVRLYASHLKTHLLRKWCTNVHLRASDLLKRQLIKQSAPAAALQVHSGSER